MVLFFDFKPHKGELMKCPVCEKINSVKSRMPKSFYEFLMKTYEWEDHREE